MPLSFYFPTWHVFRGGSSHIWIAWNDLRIELNRHMSMLRSVSAFRQEAEENSTRG